MILNIHESQNLWYLNTREPIRIVLISMHKNSLIKIKRIVSYQSQEVQMLQKSGSKKKVIQQQMVIVIPLDFIKNLGKLELKVCFEVSFYLTMLS